MLAPGTVVAGYRVEGLLGQGGMGVVYEATQLSLGRKVALKVLSEALREDPEFRERFRREGRLQAGIDHPHIVTVLEAGEADVGLFLAMRLVRGTVLKAMIPERGLDAERVVRLLGPIAGALDAAHEAGLIHRDVKPQNILVDSRDHAYLADFGLTKTPDATQLTKTGHLVGTVHYMAPEQLLGQGATAAADVYAFAAVLYECLTGDVPFPRDSEAAVIYAHVNEDPPIVTERRPDLPPGIDEVVRRGMAKDPSVRQASVGTLMSDATRVLSGTGPASAPAPRSTAARGGSPRAGATRPAGPPMRRGARFAAAAVAVAVVVLGGLAALLLGGGSDNSNTGKALTVILGSTLEGQGDVGRCGGDTGRVAEPCTAVQTVLPGGRLAAPFDGVITRWRVRGVRGAAALVVLRGGRAKDVIQSSRQERLTDRKTHEFETDLAIARGDLIGLEVAPGSTLTRLYTPQAKIERWQPPLRSDAPRPPDYTDRDYELFYNARLEPD